MHALKKTHLELMEEKGKKKLISERDQPVETSFSN